MGKFKGKCAVSCYIDKKTSGILSRAPERLALGRNNGSKIAPRKCRCVSVRLLQEINLAQWGTEQSTNKEDNRIRRGYEPDPKVYIDSIGQTRGIPNVFKARDEVKAGF